MANYFVDTILAGLGFRKAKQEAASEKSSGYRAPKYQRLWGTSRVEELPPFRLHDAVAMMTDPVVKIGVEIRDAFLALENVEVKSSNPQVAKWVQDQWKRIWDKHYPKITQAKQWGYEGLEVVWKIDPVTRRLEVEKVKDFAPYDTRPLTVSGNVVGLSVRNRGNAATTGKTRIFSPQALWVSFDARWGLPYGQSILGRSYSPWYEKWMDNGAKKTSQLRMIKDAYMGLVGYAPRRVEKDINQEEFSGRDMLREIMENRLGGASVVLPGDRDDNGNRLYELERLQDAGDPSGIFDWGKQLDKEIWFGIGITPEIVEAASTGSGFSGRSIPLMTTLQMVHEEFIGYLEAIERMNLRPAAQLNFGVGVEYEIQPIDLIETVSEKLGGSQMGGGAIGGIADSQPLGANGQQLRPSNGRASDSAGQTARREDVRPEQQRKNIAELPPSALR